MLKYEDIFRIMVDKRASHFHLVPGSPIMMRLNNVLSPLDSNVLSPQDIKTLSNDLMTVQQKAEFSKRLEIDFSYSVPGLSRFRINIFTQRGSTAMVISTNPPNPPTMEELGLPELIKNITVRTRQGLIVICGSRASGKSYTLAAMINYILETRTAQIVTIENPIKFLFKNKRGIICQREIGTDTMSYENAFASLMYQAADIVVVTEMNSYETASRVLPLAAGGTLVLATALAPSAVVFLEQLPDLFPPHLHQQCRSLLSVGIAAVISQTLVNRAGGGGVVPVFEFCIGTGQVKGLIREGKIFPILGIMGSVGREAGMQTQEQSLRAMLKKNVITSEEAYSKAVRPEELKKLMALPY